MNGLTEIKAANAAPKNPADMYRTQRDKLVKALLRICKEPEDAADAREIALAALAEQGIKPR